MQVTLRGGDTLKGRMFIPVSGNLGELLNGVNGFIEFEPYEGGVVYLAKGAIRHVTLTEVKQAQQLDQHLNKVDSFDPYGILGLARGAGRDAIRNAYHTLAKAYHPDRFAGIDLPPEVMEYVGAVSTRVNAAYAELEGHNTQKANGAGL